MKIKKGFTAITIPDSLYLPLSKYRRENGISISWYVSQAIREAFKRDGLKYVEPKNHDKI